jgi:hypothetical protein
VEYSNYFALRAAENGAVGVIVDVLTIGNIIRAAKDVVRFGSKFVAYFDIRSYPLHMRINIHAIFEVINKTMLDVEPIAKNVGIAFKYHPKYP